MRSAPGPHERLAIGAGGVLRLLGSGNADVGRLRVAVLAPVWVAVLAPGYGGIEAVVDVLCRAPVERGRGAWREQRHDAC